MAPVNDGSLTEAGEKGKRPAALRTARQTMQATAKKETGWPNAEDANPKLVWMIAIRAVLSHGSSR